MTFYSTLYNRNEAESRLQNFTNSLVHKYATSRNFDYGREDENVVSGLSPAINRRIICEWEVIKCVLNKNSYESVEKFVQEICWRTYWKGYLEHYPSIWANYLNDVKHMKDIKKNQTYIDAINGNTGIKCFDYWIKDLVQNGYLHNHTRMWFASIWVHTLMLPWQLGANIFLEHLIESDGMVVDVGSLSDRDGPRLKLFHRETPLPLSDLVPILENMGLRVLLERPHEIKHLDEGSFWKQDLSLGMDSERDLSEVGEELKLALSAVWAGKCENDRFNRLVITSGLDWRSTSLLRAYSRYLKQLRIPFSQEFIAETLIRHGTLSSQLKDLFCAMLSPAGEHEQNDEEIDLLTNLINKNIEGVEDINEDSVFRAFLCLIRATRRTNFYQTTSGEYACFISLKFVTTEVTLAPEPRPAIEVFVYSPEFEGVHLRGGKVSRLIPCCYVQQVLLFSHWQDNYRD